MAAAKRAIYFTPETVTKTERRHVTQLAPLSQNTVAASKKKNPLIENAFHKIENLSSIK